jgi:BASS family bile acid:Na+ symporter
MPSDVLLSLLPKASAVLTGRHAAEADLDAVRLEFGSASMGVLTASLALVMFGVALNLRLEDFRRIFRSPRAVLAGLLSQFLVLPGLTVLLIHAWQPAPSLALGALLVACCPGGNLSNFMSLLARGNVALSVSLTAASSLLALVMTPLNFMLWGQVLPGSSVALLAEIDVAPSQLLPSLLLMLALPLVLGMAFAAHRPQWAARIEGPMRKLSILVFMGFVVGALLANGILFRAWLPVVFLLVLVHNALAFMAGFGVAHLAGLDRAASRSLTIETGIQNSGLGLVLVLGHFEGLGGMALMTAWWGVWHIASGLALAFWWARHSPKAATMPPG